MNKMITRFAVTTTTVIFILFCLCFVPVVNATTNTSFEHARTLYNNGNYTGALYYLKDALQKDPKNVSIVNDIGSALNALGNYSGAISFYKRALILDKHYIGAFLGIGQILERFGNHSATIYFKKAIAQPINTTTTLLEKALALIHLSNSSQALNIVNQILKRYPNDLYALAIKGEILLYSNVTGALAIFNRILQVHPTLDIALDGLGIGFYKLHNYPQALKMFNQELKANPHDIDAIYNKAVMFQMQGDYRQAILLYEKVLTATPGNVGAKSNLALARAQLFGSLCCK